MIDPLLLWFLFSLSLLIVSGLGVRAAVDVTAAGVVLIMILVGSAIGTFVTGVVLILVGGGVIP